MGAEKTDVEAAALDNTAMDANAIGEADTAIGEAEILQADYLVVGAGAMGMAFVDVLMTETDATVVMVDRRSRPGGHWTDAYPFVRLHQPSSFYGVNSRPLGSDTIDTVGWNQGLYELASASEVCAYFDQVMNQQFLASGRVGFYPSSHYQGNGSFVSNLSGRRWQMADGCRIVDATYMNVSVPSTHPPRYEVAEGVRCIPVNGLGAIHDRPDRYVIVGAGKTAMDACLWLLANAVDPDLITWITPRDSWILDRARIQPGAEFAGAVIGNALSQMEASAEADSIGDLFAKLEQEGCLLRIDESVEPTMYRCATVTRAEIEQLRRIDDVVRLGRVVRIEPDSIVLDEGTIPTGPNVVHVDCSSDGLARRPVVPVFSDEVIRLQTVRTCQQVFSAAFIAHIEACYDDEDEKNRLCTVVPHPDSELDWLRVTLANTLNGMAWREDPELTAWLTAARLDAFTGVRQPSIEGGDATGAEGRPDLAMVRRLLAASPKAVENLQRLIAKAS